MDTRKSIVDALAAECVCSPRLRAKRGTCNSNQKPAGQYEVVQEARREQMQLKCHERGRWISSELQAASAAAATKTGFRFRVKGFNVCSSVWRAMHAIPRRTYNRWRFAVATPDKGLQGAKPSARENGDRRPRGVSALGLKAIAWLEQHAEEVGDRMPDERHKGHHVLRLPRVERQRVHSEYVSEMKARGEGYTHRITFARLWRDRLAWIKMGRNSGNFATCTECDNFAAALAKVNRHNNQKRADIKRRRAAHLRDAMDERLAYYKRREQAFRGNLTSLIIDGMDQKKTALPHFGKKTHASDGELGSV